MQILDCGIRKRRLINRVGARFWKEFRIPNEEMVTGQGFGWSAIRKDYNMDENFLSGNSIKSFALETANMSLNPTTRQDGNNDREFVL
jgi:hypothetical protein